MHKVDLHDFIDRPESIGPTIDFWSELASTVENNEWHKQQSVLDHTIATAQAVRPTLALELPSLSRFASLRQRLHSWALSTIADHHVRADLMVFIALLHDIGKIRTLVVENDGKTSCPNHASVGAEMFSSVAHSFSLNSKEVDYVQWVIGHHHDADAFLEAIDKPNFETQVHLFLASTEHAAVDLLVFYACDFEGCKTCMRIAEIKARHYDVVFGLIERLLVTGLFQT